jgi:hypothetical protein
MMTDILETSKNSKIKAARKTKAKFTKVNEHFADKATLSLEF